MSNQRGLRPGDFWRIDDRTGMKVPASETRKEWNGQIVHKTKFEPRHPQDFVKGKQERRGVPDPRPRPVDTFGGPLQTTVSAAAAAGALTIVVESTARFADGDDISVMLANHDMFRVIVQDVVSSTNLLLANPLPYSVDVDALVTNYSAIAEENLG